MAIAGNYKEQFPSLGKPMLLYLPFSQVTYSKYEITHSSEAAEIEEL